MNELIKKIEEIVDQKVNNHELKKEISSLQKMLKIGFEKKNAGMDKVAKIYASNDVGKISNFYESIGHQINAMKLSNNFDKFSEFLNINFGISITFDSPDSPVVRYKKEGKKFQQFSDLYSQYFLEDAPKVPSVAITKILSSLDNLLKEYNNENDEIKEQIKSLIEDNDEHSPTVLKTIDKILTSSRIKEVDVDEIVNNEESVLSEKQQGIDIIRKETETND